MRDLNKDFGAAVSEARRKLGLTQVGLAEELGKTDRSISDMENGKTTPKLDTVALFARRLGISVDAVIHDAPQGDVLFCVKQFFSGMSEEEASRYIRLCEDAQKLHEKT